jgi:RNA polymerase sigma-70 factor (ECF subfamily)
MPPLPTALPGADPFAAALEECRRFLLSVANAELPGHLTPKGGASDVVQEAIIAAYRARDRFRGRTLADLRAWLRGILVNELADFRRRYAAARRDTAREVPAAADHTHDRPGPVDQLVRAERAAAVSAAVDRLPSPAREVVVLRLEHRLGFREIGARVGRTEEAARKVFVRAVDQLRQVAPDPAA